MADNTIHLKSDIPSGGQSNTWIDLRQPLPKPLTPEQYQAIREAGEASRRQELQAPVDPVHRLAHRAGIPYEGAKLFVMMLAELQQQVDELKARVAALEGCGCNIDCGEIK